MRVLGAVVFFLAFAAAAVAAELQVKVIDPQSAAVAGAHVSLLQRGGTVILDTRVTSAEGLAILRTPGSGPYQLRILAPGFAEEVVDAPSRAGVITVRLRVAITSETVIVSATRNPVPGEESGAAVATLSNAQLTAMQSLAASDAVRFLPGTVVNTAGQNGGLSSLFVRGGDSTYNKMIVDGVTVNEPGGYFDFGTLPFGEVDRVEFVRGAQSTLYGSDAMTSAMQVWTRTGSTQVPELRFGADGGNFSNADGYASLAGARGRFDYDVFADQYSTNGSGINNDYSDSLQGANVGAALSREVTLRARFRHSNSFTGVSGEWNFNGAALEPPDPSEWSRYN
ncbi:MAG: TonB-dependent receptor plug domain-containing protein, partial [Candidatus Sulfotelmatobacter sp.]